MTLTLWSSSCSMSFCAQAMSLFKAHCYTYPNIVTHTHALSHCYTYPVALRNHYQAISNSPIQWMLHGEIQRFWAEKEMHAKKSTQKKFTWFLVLTTVDSHSKETLPEAQRTQAIKSKTWNISGAKIITNSSFNSFSRAVKMHCAGTATRCCQSPEHISIKCTKLWTLHACFRKWPLGGAITVEKQKQNLLWLRTHRNQSNMSTQEKITVNFHECRDYCKMA